MRTINESINCINEYFMYNLLDYYLLDSHNHKLNSYILIAYKLYESEKLFCSSEFSYMSIYNTIIIENTNSFVFIEGKF